MFHMTAMERGGLMAGTAVASFLISFPVRRWMERAGVVDRPNERSSHQIATIRGGGIAIMLAIYLGGLAVGGRSTMVMLGLSLGLAMLSFWDDLRSLPPAVRFGGHALAALGMLQILGWPRFTMGLTSQPGVAWPALIGALFLFLWLTGYTNAFNFMDGINGLAAGQAVVTGLGMALLSFVAQRQPSAVHGSVANVPWPTAEAPALVSLVIAGTSLGFLPHNFPRARMFMGDVGSVPLGFLLSSLVVCLARDCGWWLLIPLALLHANFILDTGITMLRRVARGERWYQAHREHFYQRLVRAGMSHAFVTAWEMGLQVVVLALMTIYLSAGVALRLILIGSVLLIWLVFFAYCEIAFRSVSRRLAPD